MPVSSAQTRPGHGNRAGGGPPDLESWGVRTGLDRTLLGSVEQVLVDENGAGRYLEVSLADSRRHVLLPAGHARIEPGSETIHVPGLRARAFDRIPEYDRDAGELDPEYEARVGRAYRNAHDSEGFYRSPDYRASWSRSSGRDEEPGNLPARVDTLTDVKVADHEDDPRGWTAVGYDGVPFGTVEHLMGDTESMEVRYVTVRPERDDLNEDRSILIPIGHVTLEPDEERVRIDGLSVERTVDFPTWEGGTPERAHERAVTDYLDAGYEGERRYLHPRYRDDGLREPDSSPSR